ncbi:hypothetical protein RJ639_003100 [Escallonia herrerae]|uniref:Zinc finger GRF-type domain-containing protein n=1 Tax=Escallonia herrerae TaxID=1293975 RepID=A0AA89AXE5_9ASTE|nr:hypothetical protein RJ639_003100 [Escallonia herrerae]
MRLGLVVEVTLAVEVVSTAIEVVVAVVKKVVGMVVTMLAAVGIGEGYGGSHNSDDAAYGRGSHDCGDAVCLCELRFIWRIVLAMVIGFLGLSFGTMGGGGGIFIPMLTLIVGFDTKGDTYLTVIIYERDCASSPSNLTIVSSASLLWILKASSSMAENELHLTDNSADTADGCSLFLELPENDPLFNKKKVLLEAAGFDINKHFYFEISLYFAVGDVLHAAEYCSFRNELEALHSVLSLIDNRIMSCENMLAVLQVLRKSTLDMIYELGSKIRCGTTIFENINADRENRLLQWGQSNDVQGAGRGAIAREDLKVGDVALDIPVSVIISEDVVYESDMFTILENINGISSDTMLLFWSTKEKHNGDSRFRVYLDTLPEAFNTGVPICLIRRGWVVEVETTMMVARFAVVLVLAIGKMVLVEVLAGERRGMANAVGLVGGYCGVAVAWCCTKSSHGLLLVGTGGLDVDGYPIVILAGRCKEKEELRTKKKRKKTGRRFMACGAENEDPCEYFIWIDPPMCERAVQVIPGLLRRINGNAEEVRRLMVQIEGKQEQLVTYEKKLISYQWKEKILWFVLLCSWMFFVMNFKSKRTANNSLLLEIGEL